MVVVGYDLRKPSKFGIPVKFGFRKSIVQLGIDLKDG